MRKPSVTVSRILVLIVILALWELLTEKGFINYFILPAPIQVFSALYDILNSAPQTLSTLPGGFYFNLSVTLYEILVAFVVSSVVGVMLGFLWGSYSFLRDTYEPLLYLFYSAPLIIIYPVIFLLFTVGTPSKIVFGIMLGLFPIIVNTMSGFGSLKPLYLRVAKSLGASSHQVFLKILLPGLAPSILGAMRLGLAAVIGGVIAAQVLASTNGLGGAIVTASFLLRPTYLWALILIVFGLAYFLVQVVFREIERRLFRYEKV